jgi:chromosome segregation ATPase
MLNQGETLQSVLPQMDAEWETLRRSIQTDQQKLNTLQQRREELARWLSAEQATYSALSLRTHLETLERQMRYIGDEIACKQLLCRALEQRFDEVRLVLDTLQQPRKNA